MLETKAIRNQKIQEKLAHPMYWIWQRAGTCLKVVSNDSDLWVVVSATRGESQLPKGYATDYTSKKESTANLPVIRIG